MKKIVLLSLSVIITISSFAQILGGGTSFSNAVTYNQSWVTGCPSGGTAFSNQVAFEPTTAIDPCAPAPACATGTTGSDIWFSFFAQGSTASIVINPSASFDVAIQAFSGMACPGLTNIGCVDAGGNNATETLLLTGLVPNVQYYFRVFGAVNGVSNRTGTYTFCSTTGLGSTVLPIELSSFRAFAQNNKVVLNWGTESESANTYFEVERSMDGNQYQSIAKVMGIGSISQATQYNFNDIAPFKTNNYYRLKLVDIDGSYKYSSIQTVSFISKTKKSISISPAIVTDKVDIKINSANATTAIFRIISSTGHIFYLRNKALVKGENLVTIDNIQNLYNGLYILQVQMDGDILSTKFIAGK